MSQAGAIAELQSVKEPITQRSVEQNSGDQLQLLYGKSSLKIRTIDPPARQGTVSRRTMQTVYSGGTELFSECGTGSGE